MSADQYARFADAARRLAPEIALVLGSGLGGAAQQLSDRHTVAFSHLPGLAGSTVAGHRGQLSLGIWANRPVLIFEGRLHYYEGHSWDAVVNPVRLAHALGVHRLLLTNAAGGIRDDLAPGALMLIRDHIEWTRPYCWRLPGPGGVCAPRPSLYSPAFAERVVDAARRAELELGQGIYAALTGPSYETPAEIRALKAWGADAVGMSTAREIAAGNELGLECAAVSCITNRASGLSDRPLNHGEVLQTAAQLSDHVGRLIEALLETLPARVS